MEMRSLLGLSGDGQEKLEFGWQLVFGVEAVGEIDTSDTTVGMNLNSITKRGLLLRDDLH